MNRRSLAATHLAHRWNDACPKPKRAIDMNPRTAGVRSFADFANRIDRPGVDVADLRDNQRTFIQLRHLIRTHLTLFVGRNQFDVVRTEPEHRNRFVNRRVSIGPGDNADSRCAVEAFSNDIPTAASTKLPIPARRIGRKNLQSLSRTRNRPPFPVEGGEARRTVAFANFFETGIDGRHHVVSGVLIPNVA